MCLFNFGALWRALLIVITDPKCIKVLNVITFQRNCNHSPKCNNIWPLM